MSTDIHSQQRTVNIRQSAIPPVMPACRNCKNFTYVTDDRKGVRGMYLEKSGRRCTELNIKVAGRLVCDLHEFKHPDRRDV